MMERVRKVSYLQARDRIAIAVCNAGQHLGILYRDELEGDDSADCSDEAVIRLFQICGHLKLRHEYPRLKDHCAMWTVPQIGEEKANTLIAYVRNVWKQNKDGQLPYGFSDPRGFFTSTGARCMEPGKVGLNCASLVLAIFDSSGLPLLLYDQWPPRLKDREFQQRWIRSVRKASPDQTDYIKQLEEEMGNKLYHPLEVAGSVLCPKLPASFKDAERMGELLLKELETG